MGQPLAAIIRSSDGVAERQRAGTYHGDEDQTADVERYARDLRHPVVLMEPELDVSGGKPIADRPSLLAAIKGVERGEYAGIIAANLKRLTRSRSGLAIWERVEAAGGHVYCAAERLDTSTPNGRFIRDIHLAEAVREREEHSDRHAKRRAQTVEAGMWRQHQLPRGYVFAGPAVEGKYHGKARRLVPGPDADSVRQAARDVLSGVPVSRVAERLGMTPAGVRAMLRNRVYLGELRDGPNVNVNAHAPVLDADTFDAVGHAVAHGPRPPRRHDGPALLAGLVRCAGCGHVMSRGATRVPVYGCAVHHSGGRCPAPASITCSRLDGYVESVALAELARLAVTAVEGRDLQVAEAGVKDAERELAALVSAVTAADLDARDFAGELRERKREVDDARDRLRAERARRPALPAPGTGAEVWPSLDAVERNALLRGLLAGVVVRRSGRGGRPDVGARVRVLRFGADVRLARNNGGDAGGIVPVDLEWLDGPMVLGVPAGEDSL